MNPEQTSLQQWEFSWPVRVYYEDTDSGGVVYYANYLKFMERARTEMLRAAGFEQDTIQQEQGLVFAVHEANIKYRKPARFNDELTIVTSIDSLGKASIHFKQSVYLTASNFNLEPGTLLADAVVKVASLHAASFSPRPIPAAIIERLQQEAGHGS
jgi:acyl-CoA thioester hydrolase